MKKWTIVVEITDDGGAASWDHSGVQQWVEQSLENGILPFLAFRVMEVIEAPYGPQHSDGVFIADSSRKGNFRQ